MLPHTKLREHELLQTALQAMTQSSAEIAPRLIVRVREDPAANQQLLPDNVKRLRKHSVACLQHVKKQPTKLLHLNLHQK